MTREFYDSATGMVAKNTATTRQASPDLFQTVSARASVFRSEFRDLDFDVNRIENQSAVAERHNRLVLPLDGGLR